MVSGYRYEVAVRDGGVWQTETHATDAAHRAERRAEYTVGSGQHAVAWIASENGYLTELPVGLFAAAGFGLNPGYELKNQRFSRPIPVGCVACHATGAAGDSAANNYFSQVQDGINCRRCHGDPEQHLAFWKEATSDHPPAGGTLIHPGRLSERLANDICLQCHLQGDVTVQLGQSSPLDFVPGQRLPDMRHDFLIAGAQATLGIASHGARMLRSQCYTASGGKLTCIHCHDPHRPVADFALSDYDRKCQSCHAAEACSRQEDRSAEGSCVKCHMPKRPTREGLHLVFTDHAMPRRPLPMAEEPSVLPPNANVELISAWPNETPPAAALGAAYVLLSETMSPQEPSLRRGAELLTQAARANPGDLESRFWLGSALLALEQTEQARAELQRVVTEQPQWHQARYRLALAAEACGDRDTAISHYERLLAESSHWTEPQARLAQLLLSAQEPAAAAQVLRRLVQTQPGAGSYASLALAERLAGASHEQSLAIVNKAIRFDSHDAACYVSRATLQLLAGDIQAARADFQRASALDPANAAARQALQALPGGR
jgi:tetratricopeptide (TPR) repeat protein